jgi:cell division protein FtsL
LYQSRHRGTHATGQNASRDDDGRRVRRRHERALVGVEVFLFAFVVVVVVVAQKNIFKYDDTFGVKLSPK